MKSFWLMFAALCVLLCQLHGQGPDPAALEKYANEGEKALSEGRYQDAEQAYKKLAELSPNTAEVHASWVSFTSRRRNSIRRRPSCVGRSS